MAETPPDAVSDPNAGRLEIEHTGASLVASIRPPLSHREGAGFQWGWTAFVGLTLILPVYVVIQDPSQWASGALMILMLLGFLGIGAWNLDRLIYGGDLLTATNGFIELKSSGPVNRRVRFHAPMRHVRFGVEGVPPDHQDHPHRTVYVRQDRESRKFAVRYPLLREDADRLVTAFASARDAAPSALAGAMRKADPRAR